MAAVDEHTRKLQNEVKSLVRRMEAEAASARNPDQITTEQQRPSLLLTSVDGSDNLIFVDPLLSNQMAAGKEREQSGGISLKRYQPLVNHPK